MSNINNTTESSALCDYCKMQAAVLKAETSYQKLLALLNILQLQKAPLEVLEKANRDEETAKFLMLKMKTTLKLAEHRVNHMLERTGNHAAAEDIRMHYFDRMSWHDIARRHNRSVTMIKRRAHKILREVGLTLPIYPNDK